ncbi:nitroreductase family protein [Spiroplasma eriocheiris]|uniref:Nitroreductase n=1 Tax=Spiroplasma eriocheiris TaxID=315358 RepID=A0A0H3XHP7_9MOLU|nr:nitroreductase family protein [Spiroplasma eriocheiris]AHF57815.1 NAD(P)H-flavin oxidoreductase [Spiroplasma eriocheiris CCTCC M 207170]AKM54263.1 nitroreductase [Spiroplasma eriocheiris]
MESKVVKILAERRTAKRYIPDYKLTDEQINTIVEAIRLAPSSFGVEPYHIVVLTNDSPIKEELFDAWYEQPALKQSSALFIWISDKEEILRNKLLEERISREFPEGYKQLIPQYLQGVRITIDGNNYDMTAWSKQQAYVSLGTAIWAAKEIGLDVTPTDGFSHLHVGQILEAHGLMDTKNQIVTVGMFVGKRDTSDPHSLFFSKVRREQKDMVKIVKK